LIDGQSIEIGVRNTDARDLRPEVGDFDGDIGSELTLSRRIPLLHEA
jgi:hypothetical protein